MNGKAFYMMFDCLDGGVVEPISLDKANLQDSRSIIIMDEDNQIVWLWHGKLRGLVQRRTAMRQAQSLKGHGYKAGNAIIGRDLREIKEIDARKVDRVPEDTEMSKQLMSILEAKFTDTGGNVYVKGSSSVDAGGAQKKTISEPKVEADPKPAEPAKQTIQAPSVAASSSAPNSSATAAKSSSSDDIKRGALILAVMSEYKDVWLSKKDDGSIADEKMDGKICTFNIVNGKVEYQQGSFAEVPRDKKSKIEDAYNKLTASLD